MTSANKTPAVDFKFEIAVIPVSDVDRAKDFYAKLGWRLDADFAGPDDYRVIQFTPPGSPASVIFGKNVTAAAPGSAQGLYLVVSDIEAARKNLLDRGVKVSDVFHASGDVHVGTDEPFLFGRVRTGGVWIPSAAATVPTPRSAIPTAMAGCSRKSPRGCPDASTPTRPSPHGRSCRRASARSRRAWRAREAQRRPARCELAGLVRRIHRQGTGRRAAAASDGGCQNPITARTKPLETRKPKETDMSNILMKTARAIAIAVLVNATILAPQAAQAQPSQIKRTDLQRHDLSIPGREVVQVRVDIEPGVAFGKHTHPGEEIIYVLEGTFEYQIEDKPPVTLKAGDVLFIPAGAAHSAKNVGNVTASELATYIVEKGKPLLTLK